MVIRTVSLTVDSAISLTSIFAREAAAVVAHDGAGAALCPVSPSISRIATAVASIGA
jgi:hypothetical protein